MLVHTQVLTCILMLVLVLPLVLMIQVWTSLYVCPTCTLNEGNNELEVDIGTFFVKIFVCWCLSVWICQAGENKNEYQVDKFVIRPHDWHNLLNKSQFGCDSATWHWSFCSEKSSKIHPPASGAGHLISENYWLKQQLKKRQQLLTCQITN